MNAGAIAGALGALAFGAAVAFSGYSAHDHAMWSVREAKLAPSDHIDRSLEGQLVVVQGTLAATGRVGDPDYLLPGDYVYVERVVEEVVKDDDDKYEWSETSRGIIPEARFFPPEVKVGLYRVALDQATRLPLRDLALRPDIVRNGREVETAVPLARWDRKNTFYLSSDAKPDAPSMTVVWLDDAKLQATERVTFRSLMRGESVTALGRQRGETIEAASFDGTSPRLVLLEGKRSIAEVIKNEEEHRSVGMLMTVMVVAFGALVLTFGGFARFFSGLISCGIAILPSSLREALSFAGMLAAAVLACLAAFLLGDVSPGIAPFFVLAAAVALIAGVARWKLDWEYDVDWF